MGFQEAPDDIGTRMPPDRQIQPMAIRTTLDDELLPVGHSRVLESETTAYMLFRVATAVAAARQRRQDDDRWMIDDYWAHGLGALVWLCAIPQLREPLLRTLAQLEANPWPANLLVDWWNTQFTHIRDSAASQD